MTTPLVTLDEYKTYKKLSKTDNDGELTLLINAVSTLVKNYLGHSVVDYYGTPKVDTFSPSQGTVAIQLNEWPIREVQTVESRPTYQDPYEVLDPVEYFVDTYTDSLYKNLGTWNTGFGAVKITYTAGYQYAPDDIKIATLDLVHHYFKEEYKERKAIGNSSIDNSNSRASAIHAEWPIHISRVLDLYKNV